MALWEIGLRKWLEKRSAKDIPEKRPALPSTGPDQRRPDAGLAAVMPMQPSCAAVIYKLQL